MSKRLASWISASNPISKGSELHIGPGLAVGPDM